MRNVLKTELCTTKLFNNKVTKEHAQSNNLP